MVIWVVGYGNLGSWLGQLVMVVWVIGYGFDF